MTLTIPHVGLVELDDGEAAQLADDIRHRLGLDDDGIRDTHLNLSALPMTHGQMGDGWAIDGRHR